MNNNILDAYITTYPTNQNIVDLFKGEWSSIMPPEGNCASDPGKALLFDDPRIKWVEGVFGGFENKQILELGPLEGGHTYMMHQRNAAKITAIDANTRSYLKCLCVKEIFNLNRARFLLGDFNEYLDLCTDRFDIVVASGVLYHMMEPVKLIKKMSQVSDKVFIWTHYYDGPIIKSKRSLDNKFGAEFTIEDNGNVYNVTEHIYGDSLGWSGFCGGPNVKAIWLDKASLIKCLSDHGFTQIQENYEDLNHGSGPAICICASK